MFKFPLLLWLKGGASVAAGRSNTPGTRDLRAMIEECEHWRQWHEERAKERRVRAAKLELIGDDEAARERSLCHDDEEGAAKCEAAARVLRWAIAEIDRREGAPAP